METVGQTVGQTLDKSLNFSQHHFQNVIIPIFQGCCEKKLGYTALVFNLLSIVNAQ